MVFMIEEKMAITWSIGMVDTRESPLNKPGKWKIKYKNANETVFRYTVRSSREIVVVHSILDLDYNTQEHQRIFHAILASRSEL